MSNIKSLEHTVHYKACTAEEHDMLWKAILSDDYSEVQPLIVDVGADTDEGISFFVHEASIRASDMKYQISPAGGEVRFVTRGAVFEMMIAHKGIKGAFFSATHFIRQHNERFPNENKRLNNYLRLKRTKELMKRWFELKFGNAKKRSQNAEDFFIEKKRNGREWEVELHKDLFYDFAMWVNTDYKIGVYELLGAINEGLEFAQLERERVKQEYRGRTDAFKVLVNMHLEAGSKFGGGSEEGMYAQLNRWADKIGMRDYRKGEVNHDEVAVGEEVAVGKAREAIEMLIWEGIKAEKNYREIRNDIKSLVHGKGKL